MYPWWTRGRDSLGKPSKSGYTCVWPHFLQKAAAFHSHSGLWMFQNPSLTNDWRFQLTDISSYFTILVFPITDESEPLHMPVGHLRSLLVSHLSYFANISVSLLWFPFSFCFSVTSALWFVLGSTGHFTLWCCLLSPGGRWAGLPWQRAWWKEIQVAAGTTSLRMGGKGG